MKSLRFCCSVLGLHFLLFFLANSQTSVPLPLGIAGNPSEVKNAFMSSNNVSFVMYNYGQFTRPNTLGNVYDFKWHGLGSMFEFGPLLAAKVVTEANDTLRIIDDGMWLANQGGYAPDFSVKWGWLPRPGYSNPASSHLATSNDPASWPAGWSSWPGKEGPGIVRGLNEAFYGMDDFTNAEFPYYPFPSDSSKRGLGVSAEVRTYEFGGALRDAVIIEWKLKNESPKNLDSCYFGFYGDPHIGGPADYGDDLCNFLRRENTIYCWDANGTGDGGLRTGILSYQFLQTPGSKGLTTFTALPYTNSFPNVPKNRPLFWSILSATEIDSNQTFSSTPGDYIVVFGTGPFSLGAGDSTFVKLAIFFSEDTTALETKAGYVWLSSHWPDIKDSTGSAGGDSSLAVRIASPDSGSVSGTILILCSYSGTDPGARVLLEYSYDGGWSWNPIGFGLDTLGSILWNTAGTRDGTNYLLRAVAYSEDLSKFFYDVSNHKLTVNNPVNAQPELVLDRSIEGSSQNWAPLRIGWNANDADNAALAITLAYGYSKEGPFTVFHTAQYPSGSQSYDWDFTAVPNSDTYYLRITASDGSLDSSLVSESFAIRQQRGSYSNGIFQHTAGSATPDLSLAVVEPWSVTGHQYEMTFSVPKQDSALLTVRDLSASRDVVSQWLVRNGISTPLFDGLKLSVTDKPVAVDTVKSGFTRPALAGTVDFAYTQSIPQSKVPHDWALAFNALDTADDGNYTSPGDTLLNNNGQRVVIAPFKILNRTLQQKGYGFVPGSLSNNKWDPWEPVCLLPNLPPPAVINYQINFHFPPGVLPAEGDTLYVITQKPLTASDVFRFTADNSFITEAEETGEIRAFELFQNYPNPFNPTTEIRYQTSEVSRVRLTVYDLLGRVVAKLVDETLPAGPHRVTWNAGQFPSGVYFVRLEAVSTAGETRSFVSTNKLLLLK
ncbi:MAG TPA: T9SS type A sorting domain-containing protein [Bacteroidota bacterium]|nr:T9SS type A sorting domain-containing protein [Bacteroidota bacterium]